MSSKTRLPRLSTPRTLALRPVRGPLGRLAWLLTIPVAVFLILAALAEGPLYRASMAAGALFLVLFGFYVWALVDSLRQGIVRVNSIGGLRFISRRAVLLLPVFISLVGLTPGLLALLAPSLTGESFGGGQGSVWWALTSGASLLWLLQMAWSLRIPVGLRVSAWGLDGARGTASVRVPWSQLASASASRTGTVVNLSLQLEDGSSVKVAAPQIGSDPNVVAAIIEFYRTHPEERVHLIDVDTALQAAEAS